jgi:UDP-N-acetylglucosamine 2-epimerase (non-hydrolysing)
MRVLTVFGTRPEAVKLAPVAVELAKDPGRISAKVCVTGQHRNMLDQVLELFAIKPDVDLDIMTAGQTLSEVAGRVLLRIEPVFREFKPDCVVVQGDTTTAMAVAIAGFYCRTKIAHVEAGLRSYNKQRPFPEEINRRMISQVADWHFAPTWRAADNLRAEGIPPENVVVTGNTVVDALLHIAQRPPSSRTLDLFNSLGLACDRPRREPHIILVTAHRRESFGEGIESICRALLKLSEIYRERIRLIYPVHPNPNVHHTVRRLLDNVDNILLLSPLDYESLIHVMRRCDLILTDSGGIQEEAPTFRVPVLVMRETTERPEGIEAGVARLIGLDHERIVGTVRHLLDNPVERQLMSNAANPYGDGSAARRIVEKLLARQAQPENRCE